MNSSDVEAALEAAGCSGGYVKIAADEFLKRRDFDYDRSLALLIDGITAQNRAALEKSLAEKIGIDYGALFEISGDGVKKTDFGKAAGDALLAAPLPLVERKRFGVSDLFSIMRVLRGENGCKWDRAQTHESIRVNAIEEAYELVSAIDNRDVKNIIEEAGDVILQGVFHTIIGDDTGEFDAGDVVSGLCLKLITRHTHIFGDVRADDAEQALAAWEKAKAAEKSYASLADKLDSVPRNMSSALRAQKTQKYAAKIGLDFSRQEQIYKKIAEETEEFRSAPSERKEEEGGDLLFSVINLLRKNGVDAECALNGATDKFARRAAFVERECGGKLPADFDDLWETAKRNERK